MNLLPSLRARRGLLVVSLAVAGGFVGDLPLRAGAPPAPSPSITAGLRPGHPRIILPDSRLAEIRELVLRNPEAARIADGLRKRGEKLLGAKPVEFKIVGPRLLAESRRCLDRVGLLSFLFRLDGDRRFRDRALAELAAAAAFPHWNPSHFLDTAEMSFAFALGYDWLHSSLDLLERTAIRTAIVEKGLRPSLPLYREQKGWVKVRHNWNQVCNGGMAIAALAVADEEREIADFILARALESVRLPLAEYGPDGAWSEGPGYWDYATRYTVFLLASLESALGTDLALADTPGFSKAGSFRIHASGPTDLAFNFADASSGMHGTPILYWLARRFREPVLAWTQKQYAPGFDPLELVWFEADAMGPVAAGWQPCARFRVAELAFLRSAWEDPKALFVGFKGGNNRANHSHLDLGTFVFDGLGERWVHDLGADDYNLPAYFGKERWNYYRLRSEGHNLVLADGENQDPAARAPLTGFGDDPAFSFAVAELQAAQPLELRSHRRGVALVRARHLVVVDELEAKVPCEVHWSIQTWKGARVDGGSAEIERGSAACTLRIVSPTSASLEVLSASGPPPQAQAPEHSRLRARWPVEPGKPLRIVAIFTPHERGVPAPEFQDEIRPLADWGK